jgi:hypothetical protein
MHNHHTCPTFFLSDSHMVLSLHGDYSTTVSPFECVGLSGAGLVGLKQGLVYI